MKKRKNILFLMSDEHRPDILGFEGNGVVRTPNLDRLASEGIYFRNAYCTSPVCVPSRQSFLSGKLPRSIGCLKFGDTFNSDITTIPEHLAKHGYHTVAFGKMHFEDVDQMHGWLERPSGDLHTKILPMTDCEKRPGLSKQEKAEKGLSFWGPKKEIRNARVIGEREGKRGKDLRYTEHACDFLREYFADSAYDRPRSDQPLCFALSLMNPHYPFQCTKKEFEYYLTRVKPFLEGPPNDHPCHQQYNVVVGEDVCEREVYRATAAYYGQVEFIDTMYGKVLETLEELNALDDFIIIYWSDHGDMLGEFGCWEKKQFYDACSRVSLIIHDPSKPQGKQIKEVVSLLDLFPTICDLAGIPAPPDLEGESLAPLMEGSAKNWKNEAVSELWSWYHGSGGFMIRKNNLKYVRYHHLDYPEQLFDMEKYSREDKNLIDEPEYKEALEDLRKRGDALPPPKEI
jgi:choline-sulfatase